VAALPYVSIAESSYSVRNAMALKYASIIVADLSALIVEATVFASTTKYDADALFVVDPRFASTEKINSLVLNAVVRKYASIKNIEIVAEFATGPFYANPNGVIRWLPIKSIMDIACVVVFICFQTLKFQKITRPRKIQLSKISSKRSPILHGSVTKRSPMAVPSDAPTCFLT
jgi:hypothetical protein